MGLPMSREYLVQQVDPLKLARALNIPLSDVAVRLGVTSDWTRRLARDYRHAGRVRRAVLELALERDDFERVLG